MSDIGSIELDDLPVPGDRVGGRYRIEQVLGSGATGVVYEAAHELTGKIVAIKWLRPDLASSEALTARFLREARAAAAIDHPNVVAVFDAGRERGSLYLVMERLRGEPLSSFLERGPHPHEVVISTLMPALRGVVAAHEHGIVHRDLKPDNVFLVEPRRGWAGGAKVLDFGISKLKQPVDGRELTHAGVFLGSPLYMAPEQIVEPSKVDARSDVYSIGVMLYEGLAGRVPFEADSVHELFRKVMVGMPPPLRDARPTIPFELEAIVLRALARDRAARPASVEELVRALAPFCGDDVELELDRDSMRPTPPPLEGGKTEIVRSLFEDDHTDRDAVPSRRDPHDVARPRPDLLDVATQPVILLPDGLRHDHGEVRGATGGRAAVEITPPAHRRLAAAAAPVLADVQRAVLRELERSPVVVAALAGAILVLGLLLGLLIGLAF
ncbi:MAG: serine/threonine protein kinase [Myxococcota bacterium]|nr:serine/threonine protein kinase [Myxococcota bacterium]